MKGKIKSPVNQHLALLLDVVIIHVMCMKSHLWVGGGADVGWVAQCLMGGTLSGNATQPADGVATSSLFVTGH